jgi:GNAT superfamily N-acetyltransferase
MDSIRIRMAMSTFPLLTPALAARIETAVFAFSVAKMEALRSFPGNPYGIEIRTFGGATTLLATEIHNDELFNRVGNISDVDQPFLDAIIDWYHAKGTRCHFDMLPSVQPELLWKLASRGYYQSGFYTTLYGTPQTNDMLPATIIIRPVLPEESHIFAEIYLESFGISQPAIIPYLRESVRLLVNLPNTHCFFALQNGITAAIAALFIHQEIGYLALAATLPAYRGQELHKALLLARMARAAAEGCTLIVGQAAFASTSQQNMEKVGLRVAYTKALWTLYDSQGAPIPPT